MLYTIFLQKTFPSSKLKLNELNTERYEKIRNEIGKKKKGMRAI